MKTETLVKLIQQDINMALSVLDSEEGYPFKCGWLEGNIMHMQKVINNYMKEKDDE